MKPEPRDGGTTFSYTRVLAYSVWKFGIFVRQSSGSMRRRTATHGAQ